MATSSILGADRAPSLPSGTDVESLGPSDSTDSGSDSVGAFGRDELASDTDAAGTGERAAIEPMLDADSRDILPDHVERAPEGEPEDELEGELEGDIEADPDGSVQAASGSATDDEVLNDLAELASLAGEDEDSDDSQGSGDDPDATDEGGAGARRR